MGENEAIVEFHIDDSELRYLRNSGRFTTAYNETRITVRREIQKITALVESKLKTTFSDEHPHPGRNPDDPYHPTPTIDTFHVVPEGMETFRIIMGGGAVFIEKGWAPHYIVARAHMGSAIESNLPQRYNEAAASGPAASEGSLTGATKLHWTDGDGDHFATMVYNPGYDAHPFVQEVINSPEVAAMIANLGRLVALEFKHAAFSPLTGELLPGEGS